MRGSKSINASGVQENLMTIKENSHHVKTVAKNDISRIADRLSELKVKCLDMF